MKSMMKLMGLHFIIICWFLAFPAAAELPTTESILFEKFKQGEVIAIMRHALAPGTGDPSDFVLGQCNTQRNLSEQGRLQAKNIGQLFRQYGINTAAVYSSQWCRCIDTAKALKLGEVKELPMINSFFRLYEKEQRQTEGLTIWLQTQKTGRPLILVTHQVNITALTGVFPSSGEIVFVRTEPSGEIMVEGKVRT